MKRDRKWFAPVIDFGLENNSSKKVCRDSDKTKNSFERNGNSKIENSNGHVDSMKQYAPESVSDLAVNSKKIEELREWLKGAINNKTRPNSILLLTGPSGCGKTATLSLLAKDLGINLSEWVTPMDIECIGERGEVYLYEKQSDKFFNFLLKSSCYPSLLGNSNSPRIVMVEDFPNYLLENPEKLVDILQKFQERGKSPLVFICSEGNNNSSNAAWKLFPPHVIEKFNINNISFNSIAVTNMKAALKRIISLMTRKFGSSYSVPNQDSLDGIINSSMGDIRSAVNYLQFSSLKGARMIEFKTEISKKTSKKGGKVKKSTDGIKLKEMGKDENISMMHGIGRVLNPKRTEENRLTHPPVEIVEQFQTQPSSFVGCIHENYLPHFGDIYSVENASDILSDADRLLQEWKTIDGKLFGLTVAVAGVMIANKTPVSCWHPIKGQKNTKSIRTNLENFPLLEQNRLVGEKVLATDYRPYYDIIKESVQNDPDDSHIEDIEDEF